MCTCNSQNQRFKDIGDPERIWAIPAIHGQIMRLRAIHEQIARFFRVGDRIVYMGNYSGYSEDSVACIDEILSFRRGIISKQGVYSNDLVYLRGQQEEINRKLLELAFAPNPTDVLLWMLSHGLADTLKSYGLCSHDGIEACRRGVPFIIKWVNDIRAAIRRHAGHETFALHQVRAVYTSYKNALLFVHAGLSADKPLNEQNDDFWWMFHSFNEINTPYEPFCKVIRGYDPAHKGLKMNCVTATLDAGCGFGGTLVCVGLNADGEVFDLIEA